MDSAKLNDWMQVIGIFALVASLVFVGFQVKQTDDIATDDVFDSIIVNTIELSSLIAENADVWARGCLGEELSYTERIRFGQVFNAWSTAGYIGWKRLTAANLGDADPQFVINSYAANLYRFPELLSLSRSMGEWDVNGRNFSDPQIALFAQGIRDRYAELAEIEPEPLVDVTWCGRL